MSTGRLKRKLGNLGVDASSTKANETFRSIGTPLPPLEKSKDSGEFVPIWKQDVRDERVGDTYIVPLRVVSLRATSIPSAPKLGWVPSTFVSSRNDHAKQKAARPEDFMDEEDLQEFKDSRNLDDSSTLVETSSVCDNVIAKPKKSGPKKHPPPMLVHMKKEIKRLAQTAKVEMRSFARRRSLSFQIAFSPVASPFTPSSDSYFPRKASVQLKRVGTIIEDSVITSQETILVASRKTKKVSISITKTKTTKKIAKVGKKAKRVFLESIQEVFRS